MAVVSGRRDIGQMKDVWRGLKRSKLDQEHSLDAGKNAHQDVGD